MYQCHVGVISSDSRLFMQFHTDTHIHRHSSHMASAWPFYKIELITFSRNLLLSWPILLDRDLDAVFWRRSRNFVTESARKRFQHFRDPQLDTCICNWHYVLFVLRMRFVIHRYCRHPRSTAWFELLFFSVGWNGGGGVSKFWRRWIPVCRFQNLCGMWIYKDIFHTFQNDIYLHIILHSIGVV